MEDMLERQAERSELPREPQMPPLEVVRRLREAFPYCILPDISAEAAAEAMKKEYGFLGS